MLLSPVPLHDFLLSRRLVRCRWWTLLILSDLLIVEQLRLQCHWVNKYPSIRPVHEAGVMADHRIDHIVIMINEIVIRSMSNWIRVAPWFR
ncbi:hypothetical protein PUN28_003321 [Cardiocondyla obscurior]|uniref:Secreted protein n=1 Tax=Cardiocondyla obscurior TaxID=286306 RepID=A0AAW2GIC8_9HYME